MVTESKEVQTQFHLSELGGTIISFNETSPLLESLNQSSSCSVVFFEGYRGMDPYAENLKELLEKEKQCEVVITDHYRLSLTGQGGLGDFSQGFCIVRRFHDFDEKRMQRLLNEVYNRPNLIWVLLVPTWPHMRLPEPLKKLIEEKGVKKFLVPKETVPPKVSS